MRVLCGGQHTDLRTVFSFGRPGQGMTVRAHVEAPAVILSAHAVGRLEVNFLPVVLAHIGYEEVTGLLIEMEAVRVAQSESPDLGQGRRANLGKVGFRKPE